MIFSAFMLDVHESNAFIAGCEDTHAAIMIDAGELNSEIIDFVAKHHLKLTTLLITHDHYDHTGGVDEIVRKYHVQVLSARGRLGGKNAVKVGHGDTIEVGNLTGTVLATPGHTPDSISLTLPGMAFTGDALFSGSIGGTSSREDMRHEIDGIRKHILSLPDHYEIHTGHGPSTTVAIERGFNPFFVFPT